VDVPENQTRPTTLLEPGDPWPLTPPGGSPPPPPPAPARVPRWPFALAALAVVVLVLVAVTHVASPARTLRTGLPTVGSTGTAGASAGAGDAASAVDGAVVDINTTLGYSQAQAAGTGIVLTSDGIVLTNNHVISGATAISVTDVGNGQTYGATMLGYDRSHDIAVIKLTDASGLQTASIGDSSALAVGDQIVGVGNAGGVGGTPSAATGTVTALDRSITAADASDGTSEQLQGLIEVDANIQAGDSGGPLVDSAGRVVGVDTAASAGTTFQGTGGDGYAIPIRTALQVANAIVAGQSSGTVHVGGTAFLGVQVTAGNAALGAAGGTGAVVAGVVSGGAADQAGLAQGDVITGVGDRAVDSPDTLSSVMATHHPGDQVRVTWTDQNGQQQSATVVLGSGPPA